MNTIDRIKHDGAVKALSDSIDSLKFEITNRNWDDIRDSGRYCRLSAAISDARNILSQMEERLKALQELEPENR